MYLLSKFDGIRGGSLITLSIGWLFRKSPDFLIGAFFWTKMKWDKIRLILCRFSYQHPIQIVAIDEFSQSAQ